MANTIFVSGATGTVGSEVVKQLIKKGASVRAGVHSEQNKFIRDTSQLNAWLVFPIQSTEKEG